ncbi:TIGR03943 family protein [Desulfocapsa sulfexigens DSM 10523]|uniref:TIGR03943 family protein n=1 Tax=Desulfocapsa sulfexigens (strain DSM 10523 / SB164P1) TaxID=1167006 RepID=M1PCX7_DESSD|nr:TIGR03943 family protein [Desulfocapsa sulfexigens]AGF77605.1 TIGR03943 family protein [Desulfocapsa sulfexigens DSM 10523]
MPILLYSKLCLLGIWALFFCWLVTLGQKNLAMLLHPSLWWLVASGTVILILFLLVTMKRQIAESRQGSLAIQWPSLLILLLPLLYFTQVQSARFNSSTFTSRILQTEDGFFQGSFDEQVAAEIRAYEKANKEVGLTELLMHAEKYTGKEVEVVCQTFVDGRLPDNLVMCYRYLMTCCAADARPIFIFIDPPEGTNVENDKWVKVKGTVTTVTGTPGMEVPAVIPDSILYVKEPKYPYVF